VLAALAAAPAAGFVMALVDEAAAVAVAVAAVSVAAALRISVSSEADFLHTPADRIAGAAYQQTDVSPGFRLHALTAG